MKKRWIYPLFPILMILSACQNAVKEASTATPTTAEKPDWVNSSQVKEGAVCSQDKGIYAKEKAYEMAINNCLIQLADKQIQGQSQQTKHVTVTKQNEFEQVNSYGQAKDQFVVTAANSENLSYELLGKYYDPVIEKVYVWIKLK